MAVVGLLFGSPAFADDQGPVAALGRIEPENGIIRVAAPSTPESISGAVVSRLYVDEGDSVKKKQLLAETDASEVLAARVAESEQEVELAVRQAEAARSVAEAKCVEADTVRSEAERRLSLFERDLVAEEEVEQAQGEAKSKSSSCVSTRSLVVAAEKEIDVARARLVRHRAEHERSRLYSPIDGLVLKVLARPGELIYLDGLLELGAVDKMYVVAEVYETDVRRVRVGQRATVTSDALAQPLGGVVEFIRLKVQKHDEIGTDPAARKDARIVEVEILLDDATAVTGLTNLQVEVIIGA